MTSLLNPFVFGSPPAPEPEPEGSLYWRVFVTATNPPLSSDHCCILYLKFQDSLGGAQLAVGGTALVNPVTDGPPGDGPGAFTGPDTTDYWYCRAGYPMWLGYQFVSPVEITHLEITSHPAVAIMAPGTFKLQKSDDGVVWTDAGGPWTASPPWSGQETKAFAV